MNRDARVFVAGGTTLPGRALLDLLRAEGFANFVGVGAAEPDLTDAACDATPSSRATRPECVFLSAGRPAASG